MLFDFYRYLNTHNDYVDCYSTFLLSRKDLKKNILKHRMNILIDIYLYNLNKKNKFDFYYYYLTNFKDSYFDKSLISDYNYDKKVKTIDITEDFDKDVKDHYYFITTPNPVEPPIDYDEIDKRFYEEELLREKEKKELAVINEDDYDEYEYDIDYYDEYEYDIDYDDYDDIDYK